MKETPKRKLYKIGYLMEKLGVTARTIRYYDQMGLLPHVKRSSGNMRLFDDEDLDIISKIRTMQKEQYLPLDVIKERLFGGEKKSLTHEVAVVTDSSSVLPSKVKDAAHIHVLPFQIQMNGKMIEDSKSISKPKFWAQNKKADDKALTVPPSVEAFVDLYESLAQKGFKRIYSIHLSEALSDTVSHAKKAAKQCKKKIEVLPIDSRTSGAGLGLFVLQVGETIQKADSLQEVDLFINKQAPLIYMTTMVNSMTHLTIKGMDKSIHELPDFVQKLVQFKPIFTVDGKKGDIEIIDCVREKEEALEIMVNHLEAEYLSRGKYANYIMVSYDYLYNEATDLCNRIKAICPSTPVYLEESCLALSTHLGPETLSVSIA